MRVNIFDLKRDHEEIQGRLVEIFDTVLSQGEYILGKEVKAFEDAFAAYIGVRYAVGVNSGTDAIKIGGLSLGLQVGDRVVTTPNTYVSTAMSLSIHGITPVFCDIELETYNMDPEKLNDLLKKEKGIRVCIPVHLYGHACRIDAILDVCSRFGARVFEDACQAHGARYKDRKVGTFGSASAFSFYPTKNLGCYGDGGIVVTDSEEVYARALMFRAYGQEAKHMHAIEGFNSRLDEVQAAILRYKLEKLDAWNEKRRRIADLYRKELGGTPLILPMEASWAYHVYHLFVVRAEEREALIRHLEGDGISTLIHYPIPIHLQKVYRELGYEKGSFPHAEKAAREIISLPMYPSLKDDEVHYVCESIRKFYGM